LTEGRPYIKKRDMRGARALGEGSARIWGEGGRGKGHDWEKHDLRREREGGESVNYWALGG